MKKYYVYILQCSDGSYYTGITNDIERRMSEHHEGIDQKCYTYSKRPVELKFVDEFDQSIVAIEREKQIKGWSRRKKEALIQKNWDDLKRFSTCLNETSHLRSKGE